MQLTTANSVNRCSPVPFPYINANTSSRDYICQVIASGCTYKLQKRFVCVCVVLIYGKIGPLKVSDFDLFLAFFDSQPLSNRQIGILLPHFGNATFIYHLHATTTTLHSLDTPRIDKKYRYVGALHRFSIFYCFFDIFRRANFRAFFAIFLQLTTTNSANRCATASFPYINANTSSKVYIYQVIASRYT